MSNQLDTRFLSSVKNGMRILRLFKRGQDELSVTEIAKNLNLPKSTAHRLITTMVNEGFLSKNPNTNRYRLGLSLLSLGGVIFSHRDLYIEAQPVLKRLVDQLGETAHICLLEHDEVVYFVRTECKDSSRLLTQMGRKSPFHCTSEGLAILAFQPEKTVKKLLSKNLYAYTPYTITDNDSLKDELTKIKKSGYALSRDQFYEGFVGIAAPIRDFNGSVTSAISVIGPTSRITEDRYSYFIKHITNAAKEVSNLLGFYG
ncbi:IclR family transcriptional regulator [Bacillus sp. M6-12]|uniref:IclR family transcriptional regulator n=1 Tax=Bacillus sp. M6-12 TaxID=2054166 RepID=UPI000C7886D5|nr:IclR family transcriptional regulator [Bacillus sp. M6-12]PLS18617.1 IclR family transcriptional regulator [Bacillus sp. M6-12]